jgi:hypothetical protein
MNSKVCTTCKSEKEISKFGKKKSGKFGVASQCKSCKNEFNKQYYKDNKESFKEYYEYKKDFILEKKKEYRQNNKEKIKEYYENNKEKKKEYYEDRKEFILEKRKEYYENNKEKAKEYYENNKECINKRSLNYVKERKKRDPLYKLTRNIGCLITISLKNGGYSKNTKTAKILGCSYEDFKAHLESQFEPWMSWKNHGKYNKEFNYGWDLDHIIPISSAKNEDEAYRLNHYTNFQPLCSKLNRDIKKDKINFEHI